MQPSTCASQPGSFVRRACETTPMLPVRKRMASSTWQPESITTPSARCDGSLRKVEPLEENRSRYGPCQVHVSFSTSPMCPEEIQLFASAQAERYRRV